MSKTKIVRHGESHGIYRVENGKTILGKSRFVYVRNLHYYLAELKIYSDRQIDCWGLMSFKEFEDKVKKGWITCNLPEGVGLDIDMLSSFVVKDVEAIITPKELFKEVEDIVAELNDKPTSMELCRNAYDLYSENHSQENKENLSSAYYAVPEHYRHFILGDLRQKDYPIIKIIGEPET